MIEEILTFDQCNELLGDRLNTAIIRTSVRDRDGNKTATNNGLMIHEAEKASH